MLFPLGIDLKLKHFAWANLFIVLLNTYFYFSNDIAREKSIHAKFRQIHKEYENAELQNRLWEEYCSNNSKSQFFCSTDKEGEKNKKQNLKDFNFLDVSRDAINLKVQFYKDIEKNSPKLQVLDAYPEFIKIKSARDQKIAQLHKEYGVLSKSNFSLLNILRAMFSHASFGHLFGNMIFLFIFGRYVENVFGSLKYSLIYLISGFFSLGAYILSIDSTNYIVGASGNVFAIMGLFYILFFKLNMRLILWGAFVLVKQISLNIKYYFPFLFLAQEFLLSFDQGASGVAHLAHVYGAVFGIFVAIAWRKYHGIPATYIYKEELEEAQEISRIQDDDEFIGRASEFIKRNPYNRAMKELLVKKLKDLRDRKDIDISKLLKYFLPEYILEVAKRKEWDRLARLIALIPARERYLRYFALLNQKAILKFLDWNIDHGNYFNSIRLIELYLEKYRRSRKHQNLSKTLYSIFDHMPKSESFYADISQMAKATTSSKFRTYIVEYIRAKDPIYGQD